MICKVFAYSRKKKRLINPWASASWWWWIDIWLIQMCACSSGTSAGERKLMPTIEDELNRRQMLYSLLMPVMNLWVNDKSLLLRPSCYALINLSSLWSAVMDIYAFDSICLFWPGQGDSGRAIKLTVFGCNRPSWWAGALHICFRAY